MARRFNSEGYADPTAYEALKRIEKEERKVKKAKKKFRFMPVVYICSPYAGNILYNTEQAKKYSRFAADRNCLPITPHLYFTQFLDDSKPEEREKAFLMNEILMCFCKELWVFGGNYSKGMKEEIRKAKERRKKIRYFTEKMEEIL